MSPGTSFFPRIVHTSPFTRTSPFWIMTLAMPPEETANRLREQGFRVAAAHLEGTNLYQTELGKKIVFLIGNEGNGLTDSLTACADCLLRIPMEGQVESLNAAMSAGLLVYEAKRQQDAHSN